MLGGVPISKAFSVLVLPDVKLGKSTTPQAPDVISERVRLGANTNIRKYSLVVSLLNYNYCPYTAISSAARWAALCPKVKVSRT